MVARLVVSRAERSIRKGGGVNADKDWKNKNFLGPGQHEDLMAALEGQFRNVRASWAARMQSTL